MPEDTMNTEPLQQEMEVSTTQPEQKQAAFTVVVQSWATPVVGILMLVVGLLGGYYGRPSLESGSLSAAEGGSTSSGSVAIPTPDTELAAQQQALMAAVIDSTRHFRGDPGAPVTIIEFSDFQ